MSETSSAILSPDGLYRYELTRIWDAAKPQCAWVLLNPSTADARVDDRTVCKVRRYTERWGYGGFTMFNLFAFRSRHPSVMRDAVDPVGPGNDEKLRSIKDRGFGRVVCGWGANGMFRNRATVVRELLAESGQGVSVLRLTKSGQPEHPLYLSYELPLLNWDPKSGRTWA